MKQFHPIPDTFQAGQLVRYRTGNSGLARLVARHPHGGWHAEHVHGGSLFIGSAVQLATEEDQAAHPIPDEPIWLPGAIIFAVICGASWVVFIAAMCRILHWPMPWAGWL